jgi:hypothetical protein
MKNKILNVPEDYAVFPDIRDEEKVYALSKEMIEFKNRVISQFGITESDVPDGQFVQAKIIGKVNEDHTTETFEIISEQLIDFPINKIKCVWIRLIPKP